MSAVPIVNLPFLYINNLRVTNNATTPNTKIDVASGQCRDSSNVYDMVSDASVTINFAVNGANGLDTGSIGASKWYYIYLISDPVSGNDTAALASLSSTPLMPFGYSAYRHIGWARSDGSSHLLLMNNAGNNNARQLYWDTSIQVLNNGSASTLTAIDVSSAVPPVNFTPLYLGVEFTPATAGDYVGLAPFGSTATALPFLSGVVAAQPQKGQLKVISKLDTATPKVLYINSAAAGNTDVFVNGFDYFI